jgi:hypothetical protein
MDQDGNPEVWDFTIEDRPKVFKVDNSGEVFQAPPSLGPRQLVQLAKGAKDLTTLVTAGDVEALLKGLDQLFTDILDDESGPRFVARLSSKDKPVDLKRQIIPILYRLMEAYGLRPTEPSKDSSTTPADTGTASTDGVPPAESTPSASTVDAS